MDNDEQQIRDEIKELRVNGQLNAAYKKAIKAIEDGYDVDWSLAWVLYDFLKREYQGANPDENGVVTAENRKKFQGFLHVIKQMGKQDLFIIRQHNEIFWTSVQRMMVSQAWELAKAGRVGELFELYSTVPLMGELYDAEPGPNSYVSKKYRNGQPTGGQLKGIDGFLSDIVRPLGTAVAKLKPLDKLRSLEPAKELMKEPQEYFARFLHDEIVSILTFQMKQLADEKDGINLWEFWLQSAPYRKSVPTKYLRYLIRPYYDAFFDKDDPSQNAPQLLAVLPCYGFDNWPDADYQPYKPENSEHAFPSFINRILMAYLKVLATVSDTKYIDDGVINVIQDGIAAIESHYDNGDNYMWLIYQYGKVLDRVGRLGELRDKLVGLTMKHRQITYLWSMLARVYAEEDEEAEMALLEMALSCPNGMVRDATALAKFFIKTGATDKQPMLKGLLDKYPKIDPELVKTVQEMPWYPDCQVPDDLAVALREDAKPQVGRVLFADQERTFYVDWNNQEKNSTGIFFSSHDYAPTKFHDQELASKVEAGKCYRAIILKNERYNDYYGNLKSAPDADLLKEFQFTVTEHINLVRDFGFLEPSEAFVNPELVKEYNLKNYDEVTGLVRKSWDSKKTPNKMLGALNISGEMRAELTTVTFVNHVDDRQRTVEGRLNVTINRHNNREMTFLEVVGEDDVFVPNDVRGKFGDGQQVTAQLERSWNKKHQEWSWRATALN